MLTEVDTIVKQDNENCGDVDRIDSIEDLSAHQVTKLYTILEETVSRIRKHEPAVVKYLREKGHKLETVNKEDEETEPVSKSLNQI